MHRVKRKFWLHQIEAAEKVVVAHDVDRQFGRHYGDMEVRFMGLAALVAAL